MNKLFEFCLLQMHYRGQLNALESLADDIRHYVAKERERLEGLGTPDVRGNRILTGSLILESQGRGWRERLDRYLDYVVSTGPRLNAIIHEEEVNEHRP